MIKATCCRPFITIIHTQLVVISDEFHSVSCYVKVMRISFLFVGDDTLLCWAGLLTFHRM